MIETVNGKSYHNTEKYAQFSFRLEVTGVGNTKNVDHSNQVSSNCYCMDSEVSKYLPKMFMSIQIFSYTML